jgi:uncharacterized protein (DUF1015 family)
MARFEPFAGYRYDPARVSLDDVVAPPYDVVGPAERAELAARSPYNAIELELPEPDDAAGLDRYEHAAVLLAGWISDGTLVRDGSAAFSVYRMTYADDEGARRSTTGVIGALGIDLDGRGDVLPHEETMPKPKGDRLDLLRATRTNLSPIWALSPVPGLTAACEAAVEGIDPAVAHDGDVVHECWAVDDPAAVKEVAAIVGQSPVLVADGHHRYETAGAYQRERAGTEGAADGPEALVMALVVELVEDELLVRPIHRLVTGLPDGYELAAALEPWFDLAGGPDDADELAHAMAERGALGLATAGGSYLLVPRRGLDEAAGAALDSARIATALAELPPHEVIYQHGRTTVFAAGRSGEAQGAFLLRPATVEQIADTARVGRRMPPKTTFFEPKPRTGMVFRTLD